MRVLLKSDLVYWAPSDFFFLRSYPLVDAHPERLPAVVSCHVTSATEVQSLLIYAMLFQSGRGAMDLNRLIRSPTIPHRTSSFTLSTIIVRFRRVIYRKVSQFLNSIERCASGEGRALCRGCSYLRSSTLYLILVIGNARCMSQCWKTEPELSHASE